VAASFVSSDKPLGLFTAQLGRNNEPVSIIVLTMNRPFGGRAVSVLVASFHGRLVHWDAKLLSAFLVQSAGENLYKHSGVTDLRSDAGVTLKLERFDSFRSRDLEYLFGISRFLG
jgi:hypothetical protein